MGNYKYLEIIAYENDEVVKRIDVTNMTQRSIDTIESGMNRNLNHNDYYTKEGATTVKLEEL